jgi:hypothetical protein
MKTTVKIDAAKSVVVLPSKAARGVEIQLNLFGATMGGATLTPDQCGALIVGIECALERSRAAGEVVA